MMQASSLFSELTSESTSTSKLTDNLAIVPAIARYFETFNQGDFEATAALFSDQGKLLPPFESEIVGREAISAYLTREAIGMKVAPRKLKSAFHEASSHQVDVIGKVHTAAFQVNAKWQFQIDPQSKIELLEIKLMATLKDLLSLNA